MQRIFIQGNYYYFTEPYTSDQEVGPDEAELLNAQLVSQAVYHATKAYREEPDKEKVQALLDKVVLEDWTFVQSRSLDILLARLT